MLEHLETPVCRLCMDYLNQELEAEIQHTVIEKQQYLQALPKLRSMSSVATPKAEGETSHMRLRERNSVFHSPGIQHQIALVQQRLQRTRERQSRKLTQLLTLKNEVDADVQQLSDMIVRAFGRLEAGKRVTKRLQHHCATLEMLRPHDFKTLRQVEKGLETRSSMKQYALSHNTHVVSSAINNVNFGFVPRKTDYRHHNKHSSLRGQSQHDSTPLQDINVAWGMTAAIVATVQRYLLHQLTTVSQTNAETLTPIAVVALQTMRQLHVLESGSRTRIRVVRTTASSKIRPGRGRGNGARKTSSTYDLFLTQGQSRISFSFGMMAFVKLLKAIGDGLLSLRQFSFPSDVDGQALEPSFRNFSVRGNQLSGHALSFLDTDFERLVHSPVNVGNGARRSEENSATAVFGAIRRWNTALDSVLQHVKLLVSVAIDTHYSRSNFCEQDDKKQKSTVLPERKATGGAGEKLDALVRGRLQGAGWSV